MKIFFLAIGFFVCVNVTEAATVQVEWKESDKYTDIIAGNTRSQSNFESALFKAIEGEFETQAAKLVDSYKMEVVIFDIDLAGTVALGQPIKIRKIDDSSFPRLNFYMFLYDKNNKIIFQGAQRLKERKAKHNAFRMHGSQSEFYFEKDLIEKWFNLALVPALKAQIAIN